MGKKKFESGSAAIESGSETLPKRSLNEKGNFLDLFSFKTRRYSPNKIDSQLYKMK